MKLILIERLFCLGVHSAVCNVFRRGFGGGSARRQVVEPVGLQIGVRGTGARALGRSLTLPGVHLAGATD